MNETATDRPVSSDTAKLIYVLYLVFFAAGITLVIGVVMAYVHKDEAPEWLQTHYRFQIRTFWIGLLYCALGFVLTAILIGFLVWLFTAIWLIVRVVKGFKYLDRREPMPNFQTWLM